MILWRKWQLTPVFLPGESHGQRSLGVYGVAWVGHNWATKHTHTIWFEESESYRPKKITDLTVYLLFAAFSVHFPNIHYGGPR